jgi:hypothetical protein
MLAFLLKVWDWAKPRPKSKAQVTFCIAHFNAADFLEITLHAVRRHHAQARIVVADSKSAGSQYLAARAVCKKFSAELYPLPGRHGHTGSLNFLFRQIRTETGVFLDQDCVLLDSLDSLLQKSAAGVLLSGPRDEMKTTNPKHPAAWHQGFRRNPQFIHASLMVVNAAELRRWVGHQPFHWDRAWGPQPLERYYGFTERIRRRAPDAILPLDSRHSGYGLGMVYLHDGHPIAYHNWYSGRIFDQKGKMDGSIEADWLRSEMSRFIRDYWAGTLDLDSQ